MSLHIEWSRATTPASFLDPEEAQEVVDGHGSSPDPGNCALWIGGGDGAIVEGSREEILTWLENALEQASLANHVRRARNAQGPVRWPVLCRAEDPDSGEGYTCSLAQGHDGDHCATSCDEEGGDVLAEWPREEEG